MKKCPPEPVDTWFLTSVFRQTRGNTKAQLVIVANIEQQFRRSLHLGKATDDEIVVLRLRTSDSSSARQMGLRVIRACIAIRESAARAGLLEQEHIELLIAFIRDADPDRALGAGTRHWRIAGGKETGQRKKDEGAVADQSLIRKARQIIAAEGRMPKSQLAELLEERACGTRWSIQKKLSKPAIWEQIIG